MDVITLRKRIDEYNKKITELYSLGFVSQYLNIINDNENNFDTDEWERELQFELNKFLLLKKEIEAFIEGFRAGAGVRIDVKYKPLIDTFLPKDFSFSNIYPDTLISCIYIQ